MLLSMHVVFGTVSLLFGAIAICSTKGGRLHRLGGRGFVVTMVLVAVSGAIAGWLDRERFLITTFAGLLAAYLVTSGWLAARADATDKQQSTNQVSLGFAITVNVATLLGLLGCIALADESGRYLGFATADYGFLAALSALGLAGDANWLWRRTRVHRRSRHLWRMCLGFFIAVGSAFTGPGAAVFPQSWQASGWLALPELLTLAFLIFWLVWVRRWEARDAPPVVRSRSDQLVPREGVEPSRH